MASRNVRMPKNQPDGVVGKKSEYFRAGTLKRFSSYVSRHTLVRPGFNIFLLCTTKIISLFIQHRELGKKKPKQNSEWACSSDGSGRHDT